jgi:hypothetical protein
LTHDTTLCPWYQKNSQNVLAKNFCAEQGADLTKYPYGNAPENNEVDCGKAKKQWLKYPAWNLPAPDCVAAPWSRDNHLGNGQSGYANSYNWTLPRQALAQDSNPLKCIKTDSCNCVLRLRYNLSTSDVGNTSPHNPADNFIDSKFNGGNSPVANNNIKMQDGQPHRLALNTNQYGRTFQDRSFVFHIKPRDWKVSPAARIHNLNVRGKRGNIVQAYPATEYDFVPTSLKVTMFDYVHFQWTGCDHNPDGNAGEGTDQTDRSNIVQLAKISDNQPADDAWIKANPLKVMFPDTRTRVKLSYLGQTNCLSYEELKQKHNNNDDDINQDPQNCMKLNAAPAYFDGGVMPMNTTGSFYYMSSRNNNFTNRSQKATLDVFTVLPTWAIVVVAVGAAGFAGSAGVAGMMLYAKTHPHSVIATQLAKI